MYSSDWKKLVGVQTRHDPAASPGPVTHDTLDQLPPRKNVTFLRAALTAQGVLPSRDEQLANLERWLPTALPQIVDPEERMIITSYATWFHLRKLRRQARRRPLTHGQVITARHDIQAAMRLLDWLHGHNQTLASCTQGDIDQWLSSKNSGRHGVRNFLTWCAARGHTHTLAVPSRISTRGNVKLPDADLRWSISNRLLHDADLSTMDRVAGCLVLLYGQPVSRITLLTTNHVVDAEEGLQLTLGTRPLTVPEPLSNLIQELVTNRRGRATLGHTDAHPWLFPGARAGHPISAQRLGKRMLRLGIPTRAGRNTALMDLATQLPATVLSRLLGLHPSTAAAWAHEAGNTRPGYAAEIARRTSRRER